MTLRRFLTVTTEVRELDVRAALALALKKELPRSRQSYARFYRRVVEELVASGALAGLPEHVTLTGVRRVRAIVDSRGPALADVARGPAMTRTANTQGARGESPLNGAACPRRLVPLPVCHLVSPDSN